MRSTRQVVEATGATARQLNHWVDRGYLRPISRGPQTGSGYAWAWSDDETEVARVMKHLVDGGVLPKLASEVARRHTVTLSLGNSEHATIQIKHDQPAVE